MAAITGEEHVAGVMAQRRAESQPDRLQLRFNVHRQYPTSPHDVLMSERSGDPAGIEHRTRSVN